MRRTAGLLVLLVGAVCSLALLAIGAATAQGNQALQIALDPSQGPARTLVTVTGTGFDTCPDYGSGGVVRVLWDGHTMIGETVREPDGTIVEWVDVPADAQPGQHTIYAQCYDGGEYATALFIVPSAEEGEDPGGGGATGRPVPPPTTTTSQSRRPSDDPGPPPPSGTTASASSTSAVPSSPPGTATTTTTTTTPSGSAIGTPGEPTSHPGDSPVGPAGVDRGRTDAG